MRKSSYLCSKFSYSEKRFLLNIVVKLSFDKFYLTTVLKYYKDIKNKRLKAFYIVYFFKLYFSGLLIKSLFIRINTVITVFSTSCIAFVFLLMLMMIRNFSSIYRNWKIVFQFLWKWKWLYVSRLVILVFYFLMFQYNLIFAWTSGFMQTSNERNRDKTISLYRRKVAYDNY